MFNHYHSASDNLTAHIKSLLVIIVILSSLSFFLAVAFFSSAKNIRLSLPPLLEYGTEIIAGQIQAHEVYMFSGYIYQQLNTWRNNGTDDYKNNIERLQYFFVPQAQQYFNNLFQTLDDEGKLHNRTRYLLPAESYSIKLVKPISEDSWLVTLRYYLYEQLDNVKIKDGILLEIDLPVQYKNKDPEYNPWGLWIDIPLGLPKRIKDTLE